MIGIIVTIILSIEEDRAYACNKQCIYIIVVTASEEMYLFK